MSRADPVIAELSRYFHSGEYESELEFAEACLPTWALDDVPIDFGWLQSVRRHRKVRNALRAIPEQYARVLAAAFEPKAFRYAWQRFGKHREVELAAVAVRTIAFRASFDATSNDGDHPQRWGVVDSWLDEMGKAWTQQIKIDGLEAYALSLGERSKVVKDATGAARSLLQAALEAYAEARGIKGPPKGGEALPVAA